MWQLWAAPYRVDGPVHEYRYRADVPMRCHACTAISARVEEYADAKHARALYFDVELTPRAS